MITVAQVFDRLRTVIDPELNINIVDLGLIYNVSVQGNDTVAERGNTNKHKIIHILMTLTTPTCPLAGEFQKKIKKALVTLDGKLTENDINIELTFDPPWVIDMMNEEARASLGM